MTVSQRLRTSSTPPTSRRRIRLPAGELHILEMIAHGDTYQAIGSQLHLSAATVAYHVHNLRSQLRASNNVTLVAIAVVAGLLTNDQWPLQLTGVIDIDPQLLDTLP